MESNPIILRTLTPEEKNSIPIHVLQKIQIEIRNLHNIHQTAMATFKRKINETELKLNNNNGQIELLRKKNKSK
ncbi:hypothetical protein NBO_195g0002 [Nosema bombycis CQ1]|uniref:Uncharacterized protein n=1 Tax=Nosema bombycis (strain CQ1 / CVCC 102059) TaxID=578461 RepID=R0KQS5_NOSB1|nr:hypothetical protein NBO_195g0002 [Nosema bombycis CQ1]|eukprot:EOB13091.1 hypothetical protein NBO_195g0002 [Nosema bombycis CQ1]